jgi:hypothetical protein
MRTTTTSDHDEDCDHVNRRVKVQIWTRNDPACVWGARSVCE